MANATLEVKMKSKTGKGIAGADKVWFNTGKGVNFDGIEKGDVVELEYNGNNGVNFVSKYTVANRNLATVKSTVPPVPSLPKTTVNETPAPGGEAPVAKAGKKEYTTVEYATADRMTKADWSNKDKAIERVAVFKSVIESAAYAHLTVGRREDEAFEVGGRMIDFFLAKLDGLR